VAALTELWFHRAACWALIATGVITVIALRFISAPYGRHARPGWGPRLAARAGWILMEAPASLLFLAIFLLGERRAETVPLVLLGFWQLHYAHRAFVFPFRMRASGKNLPLSVAAMGLTFNVWNTYINGRWVSHFGQYGVEWLSDPRFLVGAALFLAGYAINLWADYKLIGLRRPGETGYKIPRGGLFELVCSPNYLGEIIEWSGWAVMTWSLPGLAFALYTAANVGPRAASNLAWYREKFPDYPAGRKALIPFVW
jgi:hypothetical protein